MGILQALSKRCWEQELFQSPNFRDCSGILQGLDLTGKNNLSTNPFVEILFWNWAVRHYLRCQVEELTKEVDRVEAIGVCARAAVRIALC